MKHTYYRLGLLLMIWPLALLASGQSITTLAGNGAFSFGGDNGPATSASLNQPIGVALDGSGNLYMADTGNDRIRKVSAGGIITTVAGNGTAGFSGDNGLATSASLDSPTGVVVDGSGNLYIADQRNHRIRKVSPGGIITTVAGNGTGGFSGDNGPATSASLKTPSGVALDGSGNLYIADLENHRIRKMSPGGIITTVAGNGMGGFSGDNGPATSASLYYPFGMVADGSGNLYIADYLNDRIRKVSSGGTITTVAGNGFNLFAGDNGPATSASLYAPRGVALDGSGNLYIADNGNHRIRKVSSGGIITTVAGNGTAGFGGDNGLATNASLNNPGGVVVDGSGTLFYIADTSNNRIRRVSPNTAPTVATPIPSRTATVGQAFSYTLPANAFTDVQTPNSLTYTASLVPPKGLAYNAVSRVISGTPTASGVSTVTVVATDPGSLTASQSFTITVNCPVIVVSISGNLTVCSGGATTLTASGGSTYLWNTGATTAIISATAGTYSVTVTAPSGCTATSSKIVTLNPVFAATAGASSSTALVGSVVSLSATGGSAYQWSAPSGASLSSPATTSLVSATLTSPGLQTFTTIVTQGSCSKTLTVDVTAIGVPDLTATLYATPGLMYGNTACSLVINIVEVSGNATSGLVTVYVTRDQLMSLSLDGDATEVGGRVVQNSVWSLDEVSDPSVYILTTSQPIGARGRLSVGLSGQLSPGNTKGNLTVSGLVSGINELKINNNAGAVKIDYFNK